MPAKVGAPSATATPLVGAGDPLHRRRHLFALVAGVLLFFGLGAALCFVAFQGEVPATPNVDANNPPNGVEIPEPTHTLAKKKVSVAGGKTLITLSKQENDQVLNLVRKGVAYLKKTQNEDGSWGQGASARDYVAFAGLTLLESGLAKTDPAILKAAEFTRASVAESSGVYRHALFILFLDKLGDPNDKNLIELLAMRLLAGQTPQGGWKYEVPRLTEADGKALREFLEATKKLDGKAMKQSGDFQKLSPLLQASGVFLEPAVQESAQFYRATEGGDNSNTQFALLGLWAARRHNLPVDRALQRIVMRFRHIQADDGSFFYADNRLARPYPSMTCAGLLALAVGHALDKEQGKTTAPLKDIAIRKALQHVGTRVGTPAVGKAKHPLIDLYFLWSVERVGVLYQLKDIDGKDWYRWGLSVLAANQSPDGSWHAPEEIQNHPVSDTCFALLFLQRTNLAEDLTDKLTEFGGPVALPLSNKNL